RSIVELVALARETADGAHPHHRIFWAAQLRASREIARLPVVLGRRRLELSTLRCGRLPVGDLPVQPRTARPFLCFPAVCSARRTSRVLVFGGHDLRELENPCEGRGVRGAAAWAAVVQHRVAEELDVLALDLHIKGAGADELG